MNNILLDFSRFETPNSKFHAELSPRGGNVTFSNSGKGGDKKYFTLGLDSFLTCLKDIAANLKEFQGHENYIEKEWRDLGSLYYTDKSANAQSTVQTKPMFATLSKIIMWANSLEIDSIDPEQNINLDLGKIEKAIEEVEKLAGKFTPSTNRLNDTKNLILLLKEIFADWFIEQDGKKSNYFNKAFGASKTKLMENLTKYEEVYKKEFGKELFNIEESSIAEFMKELERNLYTDSGSFFEFSEKTSHHMPRAILGAPNYLKFLSEFIKDKDNRQKLINKLKYSVSIENLSNLLSIKTKPFIILAGISGTGKSRLVRKLAYQFNNIPEDKASKINPPSNYQLIKVKPNWHDSSEVLGYESRINGDRYIVTEFVRFIVKAWQYPKTPFFLCLDEMNLAPVEQYFAEYLSVLETREWKESENTIHSDDIINKSIFEKYAEKRESHDAKYDFWNELRLTDEKLKQQFIKKGLTLPSNLIVMGTVNMDETTHSFSRKVLDRAMTIEMNQIDLKNNLETAADELKYPPVPMDANLVLAERTHGHQVYEELGEAADKLITYLEEINVELDNTPFRVAYRVRDEFLLYAYNYMQNDNTQENWLLSVMDDMTCMKILPRIEGDEEKTEVINKLITIFKNKNLKNSLLKAEEMEFRRTKYHYTSFWN